MAVRFSEGLRNLMLGGRGLRDILQYGVIHVYTGTQPATANNRVQGTKLLSITTGGNSFTPDTLDESSNGLFLIEPAQGIISKDPLSFWIGMGTTKGLAGWARYCGNATDDGDDSDILPRIDLSISQSGGNLNLSDPKVVEGKPSVIGAFQLNFPHQQY